MSENQDNRVLSRTCARDLSEEEVKKIDGGRGTTTCAPAPPKLTLPAMEIQENAAPSERLRH